MISAIEFNTPGLMIAANGHQPENQWRGALKKFALLTYVEFFLYSSAREQSFRSYLCLERGLQLILDE